MLLGILISVLGLVLSVSPLIAWCFLVLSTLSGCGWLKSKIPSTSLALYFIVSVLGSLLFLASCYYSPLSGILLQLSLLLKLGFPPFQFWVSAVFRYLDMASLFIFIGPIKTGPLYLFLNVEISCTLLAIPSLFLGIVLLWLGSSNWSVIYASGSCQLMFLLFLPPTSFFVFWGVYCLSLFNFTLLQFNLISPLLAFLNLGGVPPLSMFWGKVYVVMILPILISILVLIISLLALWPYVRCALSDTRSRSSSLFLQCLLVTVPAVVIRLFVL